MSKDDEENTSLMLELKQELEQELQNMLDPTTANDDSTSVTNSHGPEMKIPLNKCSLCNFSHGVILKLTEHYKGVHKIAYCAVCDMKCVSAFHLNEHLKAAHPMLMEKNQESQCQSICDLRSEMRYTFTPNTELGYTCKYCDKKVAKRTHIITHIRTHTGEKPFACSKCKYRASVKSSLLAHQSRLHSNLPTTAQWPFPCSQCDKAFRTQRSLQEHELIHSDLRPWPCNKCEYSARRPDQLREHELDKHSSYSEELLKPHACEECGYRFKSRCHLVRHLKVHCKDILEPYLFKCEYCDSPFTERYNLSVHIRTQHSRPKTVDFKHVCSVCNKGFHGRKDLKLHSVVHQDDAEVHTCSECDFKSKHVKSVIRHFKAKHSDEPLKRLQCETCSKEFDNKSKLKRHSYVHMEKSLRPLSCSECSFKTIEQFDLKRHIKQVHSSKLPVDSGLS